ncbi:glycosyltransferase [Microbacterium sp. NPDC077391]|uniref:glycosyltransferase n=1 Tax=Microbacterium sp. NPDC077391 TaxID=3154765 RepID=UPI0034309C02
MLSRLVPVSELGTYQIALAIALALQPVATLRVDFALPGVASDFMAWRIQRRGYAAGFAILLVAAATATVLALAGIPRAAEIATYAGVLTVAYSWLAIDGGRFIRTQDLDALATRNLVSGLAAAVFQCILVIFIPTAAALTCAIVAARFLAVGLSRMKARARRPLEASRRDDTDPYPTRRMITTVTTSLLDTLTLQSFVFVPGAVLGASAAGYMGMTQRITTSPASMIVGGLGQVAQARVSQALRGSNETILAALMPTVLRLGTISLAAGLAVAFIAPPLVVPVLGESWAPLESLLPITAPALALQLLSLTLVPVGILLAAQKSLLALNVVRLAVVVGGTAITATLTQNLLIAAVWWSISTSAGYCIQLLIIVTSAYRTDRRMQDLTNSKDSPHDVPLADSNGVGKNRARILLLAKRFPPAAGGVAQYSLQVGRAYARHGYDVVAVTQAVADSGWHTDDQEPKLRVLNVGKGSQLVAFMKFLRATLRLVKHEQFQLVHATTWKMSIVAQTLRIRAPRVVTVHGREALNVSRFGKQFFRRTLVSATKIFAVSNATKEVALAQLPDGSRKDNWLVQYNGVSLPDIAAQASPRATERSPIEVFSLCRLVPRKNIAATLRAVAEVRGTSQTPLRYRIAGAGPERGALETLSTELGLSDIVEFLGFVSDDEIPDLYAKSDIFLHPHTHVGEGNDFEGFGITIADAMSFGCAVIVGNAGGPCELVEDGVDGRLIDGLNDRELTQALGELVADGELRRRLGAAAQRTALDRFSWDLHIAPALRLMS